jgi:Predicted membrane protein
MGIGEMILTAIVLSMDAFAVAVSQGLGMKKINMKYTGMLALFFGGFQAGMPLIGWALGSQFQQYIEKVDHWIAFCLLSFLGAKMIYETLKEKNENIEEVSKNDFSIKQLFVMALATSVDALAVGIMFAIIKVEIVKAVSIIGICTFLLSAVGVVIGNTFGAKYKNKAVIAGGSILILIGLKILLEHTGILFNGLN